MRGWGPDWAEEGRWPPFERSSRRRRLAEDSPQSSPLESRRDSRNDLSLGILDEEALGSGLAPGRSSGPCSLEATHHPSATVVAALVWATSP